MHKWVVAAAGAAMVLGGCSINQKAPLTAQGQMCDFVTHEIGINIPQSGNTAAEKPLSPIGQRIELSLAAHDALTTPAQEAKMLFLSGGSEHGAYGAGILNAWGSGSSGGSGGTVPDLQVVTGVSTGSILATFAFINKGDFAVDGYTISNEDQLINVYSPPDNGKPGPANFIDLIEKGAFGDLEPLRGRLEGFLTRTYTISAGVTPVETTALEQVAIRYAEGRLLYVGAVNADSGKGTAFDLGDMAARYVAATQAGDTAKQQKWLTCYTSAILASSSTPMAAKPIFIDNTMYIDGGVRFGLFGDDVVHVLHKRKAAAETDPSAPAPPRVYAVIDGTLEMPPSSCPKKDPADCTGDPATWTKQGQHKDWNIAELALRSEKILVNQVYRFSAADVEAEACEGAGCFNFLRIEPDVADFGITLPASLNEGNTGKLTCAQWKAIDIKTDNPIEFHKRYMRCLIQYGETKVSAAGWGTS